MPTFTRVRAGLIAGAAGLLLAAGTAAADADSTQARVDVIARGLDSPRGLDIGPAGVVYIAEAGSGGDGPCIPGPEGGEVCFGESGKITALWHGHEWTVADDLPSTSDEAQAEVTGVHDVAASPYGLIAPVGLGADPADRDDLGPAGAAMGTVLRVSPWTGYWKSTADLAAHEAAHDPDADQPGVERPDSNPFGLMVQGSKVTATDAGGNDVLIFKLRHSGDTQITTQAVLPFRFVDAPPFLELPPGTEIPMQPVPTAVASQNGTTYVSQLTGFPFPKGAANVYRLSADGPKVAASGFTNIADIAFDRKGRLLVLEMVANGLLGAEDDPSGALWRIERDGGRTLLADGTDGLLAPAGVAVAQDGSLYVTNKSTSGQGEGELLRIRP